MKRLSSISVIVLCLFLNATLISSASAKESWNKVQSKNFTLVGNASDKEIRKVATRLEQFRDVFSRLFPKAKFTSPIPTTVVVFKSDNSYKPFKPLYQGKPANVAGYFQSGEDVNYITLTTETSAENPYRTIFHEYVHLLVNNTLRTPPPVWFNEGLAEYYSTFEIEGGDKKAQLGNVIANHVLLLREKFIPLRALLAVGMDSPLYNERSKQSVFYAESWALMHYLILGNNGARKLQIGELLSKLAAGASIDDAFRQAFKTDYDGLEKELRDYVKRNSYPAQLATFDQKLEFDSEMQSAPITDAEAQFYLGDLLLHTNRLDDAATRLQQALALDANQSAAHASLGLTRMRQKQFAEAKAHLEQAVAGNSQNYLAHYYYAYTLSREGMNEAQFATGYPADAAATMRAELHKAIDLNPNFPESYHLLAFVNLVTNEQLDQSIGLLKRAIALAPGREHYTYVLAQIYLRKQDFKTARQLLEPLARSTSNGTDTQLRAHAQGLLNSIASMEEQMARYKSSENNLSSDAESTPVLRTERNSTDAENAKPSEPIDEKAAMKAAMHSALQDALRKPGADETRARGLLQRIDCDAKGATFNVKIGERILKLRSADFASVSFTAYTPDASGEINCGTRNPANAIVVTYRPAKDARVKLDGEIVAIEFVPKDFELKP